MLVRNSVPSQERRSGEPSFAEQVRLDVPDLFFLIRWLDSDT
jgi:hypothetical protein